MSMGRMMAGRPETGKRMGLRPHVILDCFRTIRNKTMSQITWQSWSVYVAFLPSILH